MASMESLTPADLRLALIEHGKWLRGEEGGERLVLYGADLRGANLYGANLNWADLTNADLTGADLRGADLRGANLYGADLAGSDLSRADLYGANLYGANLNWADLRRADLRETGILRISTTYEVTVYPDGRLHYGCETRGMDEWLEVCDERAAHYQPEDPARYANEIRAIIAMARNRSTLR
jgi:hypothetical protein